MCTTPSFGPFWSQLVAAFRATLEEIQDASLLLHVVDVSHPNAPAQVLACQPGCVVVCVMFMGCGATAAAAAPAAAAAAAAAAIFYS